MFLSCTLFSFWRCYYWSSNILEWVCIPWIGKCRFQWHLITSWAAVSQGMFSSSSLKLYNAHTILNHDIFGWPLSNCQHLCHVVGCKIAVCHHKMYSPYLVGSIEQVLGNPAVISSLHMTGPCSTKLQWISLLNCCMAILQDLAILLPMIWYSAEHLDEIVKATQEIRYTHRL